jgi:hypothetical protein
LPSSLRGIAHLLALLAGLAAGGLAGCARDRAPPREDGLPEAWHAAQIDPEKGGRLLAAENRELTRFQEEVLLSGSSFPYPHYHDSQTVVMAIRSISLDSGIRRRLKILLENEASDSGLSVLAITDQPASRVAPRLDLDSQQLTLIEAQQPGRSGVSYPFLRDYAPLVRVEATPSGLRTSGLVLYRESRLNKIIDAELGVRFMRREKTTRDRYRLTERLVDVYRSRIARPLTLHYLGILMDGGNLITDGRGTCFLTDVVLDKNDGNEQRVRDELREKAGCARTVLLAAPQRLDFLQHVDTLLYFADPQNVILSMPTLYPSDRQGESRNIETLLSLGYKVHRVPRKTASITYANLLTTRQNVYVPQYSIYQVESDEQLEINRIVETLDRERFRSLLVDYLKRPVKTETVRDDPELAIQNRRALEVVQRLFPQKRVVPVNSDETNQRKGSWHCWSHELPERL